MIPNVQAHWFVVLTIAKMVLEVWIAAPLHAMMTLTALIKNAILTPISVDWIHIALIGPSAVRTPLVQMRREIVISTQTVREHFSVAITIVLVDKKEWTAVQMMVM